MVALTTTKYNNQHPIVVLHIDVLEKVFHFKFGDRLKYLVGCSPNCSNYFLVIVRCCHLRHRHALQQIQSLRV